MASNTELSALIQAIEVEPVEERKGPSESIWKLVKPIVRQQRYREVNNIEDARGAVLDIQNDLSSIDHMKNFTRMKALFARNDLDSPSIWVSV